MSGPDVQVIKSADYKITKQWLVIVGHETIGTIRRVHTVSGPKGYREFVGGIPLGPTYRTVWGAAVRVLDRWQRRKGGTS